MPAAAAASTSSVIRPRPSNRLNSEWTWRCEKSFGATVTGAYGSAGPGSTGGGGPRRSSDGAVQRADARGGLGKCRRAGRGADLGAGHGGHEDRVTGDERDRHGARGDRDVVQREVGGGRR